MLYCINPGARPTPTIFATIDEGIAAMVSRRLENAGRSKEMRAEVYQQVLEDLTSVNVHPIFRGQHHPAQPLLHKNPNYTKSSVAPEFFICMPNLHDPGCFLKDAIPDPNHQEIYNEFKAAMDSLMPEISTASVASTRENSFVIWSDSAVQHERGIPRARNTINSGRRSVDSLETLAEYDGQNLDDENLRPASVAAGAWLARVEKNGEPKPFQINSR
jgi:hypothetical protein